MKRRKLLRPQCRVSVKEEEDAIEVSITIPGTWLDLDYAAFHEKMDDSLGAMMQVFEAGRTEREREREMRERGEL